MQSTRMDSFSPMKWSTVGAFLIILRCMLLIQPPGLVECINPNKLRNETNITLVSNNTNTLMSNDTNALMSNNTNILLSNDTNILPSNNTNTLTSNDTNILPSNNTNTLASNTTSQPARKFRNEPNTTLASNITSNIHNKTRTKLPYDAIQLNIIQNVVDDVSAVLSDQHQDNRSKRGIELSSSLTTSSQVIMVKNVMKKMQDQLEYLTSSKSLSSNDRKRISALESAVEELQLTLNDYERNHAEALETTSNKLERSVLIGIVQSIKYRHFSFAEEQLELADDSIYERVVRKVYNQTGGNIKLIRSFGGSVQNTEKKLKIYETLYNEICTNGHTNVQKLLKVVQSVRKGILDVETGLMEQRSRSFICTILEDNCNQFRSLITTAFHDDKCWPIVKIFKDETYRSCGWKLIGDIYTSVAFEVLNTMEMPEMLSKVDKNLNTVEERVLIHEGIIKKLESKDRLCSNGVVPLARHLKMTWDDAEFNSEDWRYRYKIAIEKLPSSLRNTVLYPSICIKNSHSDEYLYAADCKNYNNTGYRSVFTWMPKDNHESAEFMWKVSYNENYRIKFLNEKYNEYLTYLPEGDLDRNYAVTYPEQMRGWNIEVCGEGVQLRFDDENLFVDSDTKQDDTRRNVFTYKSASEPEPGYFTKWELVDCSDYL